jgi:hypothetical protein
MAGELEVTGSVSAQVGSRQAGTTGKRSGVRDSEERLRLGRQAEYQWESLALLTPGPCCALQASAAPPQQTGQPAAYPPYPADGQAPATSQQPGSWGSAAPAAAAGVAAGAALGAAAAAGAQQQQQQQQQYPPAQPGYGQQAPPAQAGYPQQQPGGYSPAEVRLCSTTSSSNLPALHSACHAGDVTSLKAGLLVASCCTPADTMLTSVLCAAQGAYLPHQYPPQQGAYPPQQGAYPPQQQAPDGSYPPGAYPPQQQPGGYPAQQQPGAYPPQQQPGGYPSQQVWVAKCVLNRRAAQGSSSCFFSLPSHGQEPRQQHAVAPLRRRISVTALRSCALSVDTLTCAYCRPTGHVSTSCSATRLPCALPATCRQPPAAASRCTGSSSSRCWWADGKARRLAGQAVSLSTAAAARSTCRTRGRRHDGDGDGCRCRCHGRVSAGRCTV